MTLSDTDLAKIVDLYKGHTDGPDAAFPLAQWFRDTLYRVPTGEMAVEVGVRLGGMSAILAHIAMTVNPTPGFMVASVDPYGGIPFYSPRLVDWSYDESESNAAKELLRKFDNCALFRMTGEDFIHHVLPSYRWWFDAKEHPVNRRFVSFTYLDGQHDAATVVSEAIGVLPYTVTGGSVVIDNTEACPEAVQVIAS